MFLYKHPNRYEDTLYSSLCLVFLGYRKSFTNSNGCPTNSLSDDVDEISKQILEIANPSLLQIVVPLKTNVYKDLYRAVSFAQFDDASRYQELVIKVLLEFRHNPTWYNKNHPLFCSPFANNPDIFLEDYSNYLESINSFGGGIFCDINHILALSAVLETPIESYFPTIRGITHSYSRIIKGRGVKEEDDVEPGIRIMWTSTNLPNNLENFIPNHFVPLIQIQTAVPGSYSHAYGC